MARVKLVQADALVWMKENVAPADASVITSLPDLSELPFDLETWKTWFVDAARAVMRWVPEDGVAIFYQSDIKHRGAWIDKGYLVMKAAEAESQPLAWHKIVCRKPVGTFGLGRPGFSHMICVSRRMREPARSPEVLASAGEMSWSKAMGEDACLVACNFVMQATSSRTIVDPFCGRGTVLRVADALGLASIGIDISGKRIKAARRVTASPSAGDPSPGPASSRSASEKS